MGFGCPVCNGLSEAEAHCRRCGRLMRDAGRLQDYYADYSPYREIDSLRRTNGYLDLQAGYCMHTFYCPECELEEVRGIPEQPFN